MTITEYAAWLEAQRDRPESSFAGQSHRAEYLQGRADAFDLAAFKLRDAVPHCDGNACAASVASPRCYAQNHEDARYLCTLKHGHKGPHTTCWPYGPYPGGGVSPHNIHVWGNP